MRRAVGAWLLTVAVLLGLCIALPRWAPDVEGDDLFPRRARLGNVVDVGDGRIRVVGGSAAPRWDAGDDSFVVDGGVLLRIDLEAEPAREAAGVRAFVRHRGVTYRPSDRAAFPSDQPPEPGFVRPVVTVFEIPDDVLTGGELRAGFDPGSTLAIPLAEMNLARPASLGGPR